MSVFSHKAGHPIVGRGDLVDAIGVGDENILQAVADQLGLSYRGTITRPREHPASVKSPVPPATRRIDSSGYPANAEDIALWLPVKYAAAAPLPELPDGEARIQWRGRPPKPPQHHPMAPWKYIGPILRRDLSDLSSTNRLDIPKLVKLFAEQKVISGLPRRKKRRWGLRFQIVIDTSLRLSTFQDDHQVVIANLSRLIPEQSLDIAAGSSPLHLWNVHAAPHREHVFPTPVPGSHILILGDLGCLAQTPALSQAWMRWGRTMIASGCHLQALVPCPVSRVPATLRAFYAVETWQKGSPAPMEPAEREALVRQLLVLASPAIRVEPGLLRDLRRLIPAANDASLEADFWNHDWLSSNHPVAATLDYRKVNEVLRPQFERLQPGLRQQVLECIRAWRMQTAPEVWLEEVLSLSPASRALLPEQDLEDAHACIRKVDAERRADSAVQTEFEAYLYRLTQRVSNATFEDPRVGRLLRKARRELHPRATGVAAGTDPREIPGGRLRLYRASVADHEVVLTPQDLDADRLPAGALMVRSSNQHFACEAVGATSAQSFWKSGQKPSFVSDFGTDQYGAWCEFRIPGASSKTGDVSQRMRWIRPGSFLIGSPDDEPGRYDDEGPRHRVTLTQGFWLTDTPCTQELWEAITGENPSRFRGERLPVEQVSWLDVQEFLQAAARRIPGLDLSLPSEAQWEYACRAGTDTRYWCGDELRQNDANFGLLVGKTSAVKSYPCNPWGLYDMHGNVYEWCRDFLGNYGAADTFDPTGPADGSGRVIRGGCWDDSARRARSAYRGADGPGVRWDFLGFRCLSSAAEPAEWAEVPVAEQGSQPTRVGEADKNFGGLAAKVATDKVTRIPTGWPVDAIAITTDLEELHFSRLPRPGWATTFGRDTYGVFAEFELAAVDDPTSRVTQRLRWIPPGRFTMGSPADEPGRFENEVPHEVTITAGFWMFETPCTQRLWLAVMGGKNPSRFPDPDRPVEQVNWQDATDFAERINEHLSGLQIQLPTEAQWEYACRAGSTTAIYSGPLEIIGDANAPDLDPIAWYRGNSGHQFDHEKPYSLSNFENEQRQYRFTAAGTRKVKQKRPNPWGLYDMLGNVWEWCQDWHGDYDLESSVDPAGPADGSYRVIRGGGWDGYAQRARSAYRGALDPGDRWSDLGFRCLSSVTPHQPQQAERVSASESEPRDEAAEKQRTK